MRTHRSDLGQIAQAVWNSGQGRFVEMTDNGFVATRMTDHVEPMLALISPLLWFWRDVRALLFLQVVLVALGALPLYALALRQLDTLLTPKERTQIWQREPLRQMTRPLALAMVIAYLLTPQLQSALLTEFHAVPLAVPLILWAFWAVEARRPWQFAVATLLVAATKEELALLAAGLAAWALWRQWLETRKAQGNLIYRTFALPLALLLLTLAWFYWATFVIVPAHAERIYATTQSVYFERYGALGDSPLDIAKSFITQPQQVWQIATEPARRAYLWDLLASFGLLSLLAPEVILLALPLLLANLLSAYPAQYYGEFHYSAPLVPYVAVSAVYGLARLWRWSGRRAGRSSASYQHMAAASSGTMALMSLLTNARTALRPLIATALALWLVVWATGAYLDGGRGPWGGRYDPVVVDAKQQVHVRLLPFLVAQIPADAAVTATAAVHPHLSLRRYVYQFPLGLPELGRAGAAEWALLDVTTNTDMAPGDLKTMVDALLAGAWGVVDGRDGFLLLQRGAPQKAIPDAFYDFARSSNSDLLPALTEPSATTQLFAVELSDWPRWRQTRVHADWLVGTDVETVGFTPDLTFVTPDGEPLHDLTTAAPPALIWYPPTQWRPGERVHVTTLSLSLPKMWGAVTTNLFSPDSAIPRQGVIINSGLLQTLVGGFARAGQIATPLSSVQGVPPPPPFVELNPLTVRFVGQAPLAGSAGGEAELSLHTWGMAPLFRGSTSPLVSPGSTLSLWLRWQGSTWPSNKTTFVHLRANGVNLLQRDGLPRFFVYANADELLATEGFIDDSRQLQLPADLPVGTELSLVVGLYDAVSGERMEIVDRRGQTLGNEWEIAKFTVGKSPVPDQACALRPGSCGAQ